MGNYLLTIVPAAILVSVLQILSPGKSVTAIGVRFAASLFLVTVAIKPLVNIRIGNTYEYFSGIETDASSIIDSARKQTDDEITAVIKQRAEEYIYDIALQYGAEVEVYFVIQPSNPYLPESVTITGAVAPLVRERISSVLEKEFDLPKEAQMWKSAK